MFVGAVVTEGVTLAVDAFVLVNLYKSTAAGAVDHPRFVASHAAPPSRVGALQAGQRL